MKNNLHNETSFIDCLHVISKFLVSDSKSIPKIEKKKTKKTTTAKQNKKTKHGKKNHDLFLKSYYHKSIISHKHTNRQSDL